MVFIRDGVHFNHTTRRGRLICTGVLYRVVAVRSVTYDTFWLQKKNAFGGCEFCVGDTLEMSRESLFRTPVVLLL